MTLIEFRPPTGPRNVQEFDLFDIRQVVGSFADRPVDPTSAELSLEDLRREPTIYLLPEYDTEEEARGYVREYCSEIFEEQLDGWYRVPSAWPVDRTFETFMRHHRSKLRLVFRMSTAGELREGGVALIAKVLEAHL